MKTIKYILLIGFYCLFFAINSFPQSPVFRHYTVDDGLPSSEVFHVIQDKKGYIWFATNIGVSRFDGYKFENFDMQDGLPDNTIFEIFEDYKGRLWFVSFSCQLSYFYNDTIHQFKHNSLISGLKKDDNNIIPLKMSFFVDTSDIMYLGTKNNGIIKISDNGKIERINFSSKDESYCNLNLIGNKILCSTTSFFTEYLPIYEINVKPYQLVINSDTMNLSIGSIYRLIGLIHFDSIILLINNYLVNIAQNGSLDFINTRQDLIWLSIDSKNNLWLGSLKNGVFCYENANFQKAPKHHLLRNFSVSSVYEDFEGGFWFTSLENGVYYIPSLNFKTISKENGLHSNNISCVEVDEYNTVWIGMASNYIAELREKLPHNYQISNDKSEVVSSILYEHKNLFIGTNDRLYKKNNSIFFEIENNHPRVLNIKKKYSSFDNTINVISLSHSKNSNIILSNASGFLIFDGINVKYHSCFDGFFRRRTKTTFQKNDNKILLGCMDGLWEFDGKKYTYYGEKNELLKSRILEIKSCDFDNNIWIGTKGNGILLMNDDTVQQLTTKDGLTSNTITSIAIDSNIVWAASNAGLNKIEILKEEEISYKIQHITTTQGLVSNEINQLKVKDSMVYLATTKGLSYFNKKKLKLNKVAPPVYINAVKIMNSDTVILSAYKLPYHKNHITIDYVGLNYKNAGNVSYEYKMEGTKTTWIKTKNMQIQFPFLSPGKYKFMVRTINEDGIKSMEHAYVSFVIKPPFWKVWWFIAIVFISSLLLIYFYFQNRLKTNKIRNQLREEALRNMQKALSAQLNPHFIFNSLNSIQAYILRNDVITSNTFISKFANLMRRVLDNSQETTISLSEEIETLTIYIELEQLRFNNKFDHNIVMPEEVINSDIRIPALLLQPFIENAIIHGLRHRAVGGHLKIEVSIQEKQLVCVIEDNGIGREKAMEINSKKRGYHQSYGVEISQKRLELHKYLQNDEVQIKYHDLKDENGNPSGTRVEIIIGNA